MAPRSIAWPSIPSISAPASFSIVANHTFNSAFGIVIDLDNAGNFAAAWSSSANTILAEAGAGFVTGTATDGAWHSVQANVLRVTVPPIPLLWWTGRPSSQPRDQRRDEHTYRGRRSLYWFGRSRSVPRLNGGSIGGIVGDAQFNRRDEPDQ